MSETLTVNYANDIEVRVRHNRGVRVTLTEQGPRGPAGDITPAMLQTLADGIAARDAAQAAAIEADSHADVAQGYRNDAQAAKTAAEAARTGANIERQAAETSRQAADIARSGAETARTGSQTARTQSETAKTASEAARDAAATSRDVALGAQTAAETALASTITTKDQAETARAGAEAAETSTVGLRDEVLDALDETEEARDVSIAARNAAQTAAQSSIDTAAVSLTIQPVPVAGTNLNAVTAKGIYLFDTAGDVTTALNFPAANRIGRLVVMRSGARLIQEYTDAQATNGWLRISTDAGATWSVWAAIWNSETLPPVSQVEAEAGTATAQRVWSSKRVRENVEAYASPLGHKHVAADITDLQPLLDAKSDDGHVHPVSDVTGLQNALDLKAPLASPALTGNPTAPTQDEGDDSQRIATTAFVKRAFETLIDAAPGALDTLNEIAAALGDDPNFATTITNHLAGKSDVGHQHPMSDVNGLGDALALKAPLESPALTGNPTVPNQAAGSNNNRVANTAFVAAMGETKAAVDHVHGLDELTDVDVAGVVSGKFLKHASGLWVPSDIQIADVQNLETSLAALAGDILELTNNAILIDGQAAKLPKGPTSGRPANPGAGYIRYNETSGKFEGYGVAWGNIGGGAAMTEAPPTNPAHGDLWWPPQFGVLLVRYDDGQNAQWVAASPTSDPSLFVLRSDNLASLTDKNVALQNLGGTTLGMAIFKAASAAAARELLGLRRQRIDLAGKTTETVDVPSGAKSARLEVVVFTGNTTDAAPTLRFGVGGTIFTGASQYAYAGSWVGTDGTAGGGQANSAGMLLANNTSHASFKQSATAIVPLDRDTTSELFTMRATGAAMRSSGAHLFSHFTGWLAAAATTALRIDQLAIAKNAGPAWGANSHVWIDWLD